MKTIAACVTLLLLISLAGCGPVTFVVGVTPGDQQVTSTLVRREAGAKGHRIAIVDVTGLIVNGRRQGLLREGENPVDLFVEELNAAAVDARVKAVVLRLNTPGGTVTASDVMCRELQRFRERTGKPVVALMMDVAASGGYYVATAADEIVAYPTTVTGSIGVIVQTISVKQGLSRIGIHAEAITSGDNKDAGSPLSQMTPEHRAVLQNLVDDFYAQFIERVRTNRPGIAEARFAEVTDGRVLSGVDAAEAGLVDQVGDLDTALSRAKARAGIAAADVILYHRPLNHVASPYASVAAPSVGTQVNLAQINLGREPTSFGGLGSVAFLYLWQPILP